MKERIMQLIQRYQKYSARERNLIKTGAAALCCAVVYYGGIIPLDNMIKNSQTTLRREQDTLRWMRAEIDKNHLAVRQVTISNPRHVIEASAQEIHLPLTDVRQDGQTLAFVIERVNVDELKNWLREINMASGVQTVKLTMVPVDRLSDVKAQVLLSWQKTS
ncbi:type II secretion system protein GspM [Entomohabitans teleogrylli]|uniref:type II secretion system protein GspM n=1 Tax=Entomohabitans teleogrylli TaxID=1384589 RepID=UPI00073D313E|nr:type II secretion system protein M [Entomohabitans teleogrylli]